MAIGKAKYEIYETYDSKWLLLWQEWNDVSKRYEEKIFYGSNLSQIAQKINALES